MNMVVYGIPNCDTVKKARTWLSDRDIAHTFHDFKKQGVTETLLLGWLSDVPLDTLLNRRGTTWRALSEQQKEAAQTPQGAVAVMTANPSVIKRPVVEVGGRVVAVGFTAGDYAAHFE
jgi:arsenate reductase (glutaredoxin)